MKRFFFDNLVNDFFLSSYSFARLVCVNQMKHSFECLFLVVEYSFSPVRPNANAHTRMLHFSYFCLYFYTIAIYAVHHFVMHQPRFFMKSFYRRTQAVPDSKKMRLKPTFRRIWKSKYVFYRFALCLFYSFFNERFFFLFYYYDYDYYYYCYWWFLHPFHFFPFLS